MSNPNVSVSGLTWLKLQQFQPKLPPPSVSSLRSRATPSFLLLRTNALESLLIPLFSFLSSKLTENPNDSPFLINSEYAHSYSLHCCHHGPSHPILSPGCLLTAPLVSLLAPISLLSEQHPTGFYEYISEILCSKFSSDSPLLSVKAIIQQPSKAYEIRPPSTFGPISYISPPCLLCFRHVGLLAVPKHARKAFTFS